MSCKYPKESRMHYACILCDEKNMCKDTITSLPLTDSNIPMPEVQSPKNVIPSASEANNMTNNAINSCTTQQLAKLSKLIRDAIADGKFSISEDGSLFGKSMIFVAMAEGIALYGLIISFMILGRLG